MAKQTTQRRRSEIQRDFSGRLWIRRVKSGCWAQNQEVERTDEAAQRVGDGSVQNSDGGVQRGVSERWVRCRHAPPTLGPGFSPPHSSLSDLHQHSQPHFKIQKSKPGAQHLAMISRSGRFPDRL